MTIVRASGSTPQRTGAKMLVFADGRTVGTIGGGCYENCAGELQLMFQVYAEEVTLALGVKGYRELCAVMNVEPRL